MKGKGQRGSGQRDEEEDEYMRRIRARAEIEQDPDEYSDGEGDEEEQEASAEGEASEGFEDGGSEEEGDEEEEDGFAPGRGYDTEEDGSDSASSSDDEAGQAKKEALAAVRGLPLAERLALMASGALHDTEGAGGPGGFAATSRRRRRMAAAGAGTGAGAAAQGGDVPGGKGVMGKGKSKNKHAPTEVSSKKPVPRIGAGVVAAAPTGGGKRRKARDPRFDPALGKVNYDAFRQAYGFLEEYQEKELQALQTAMKKAKSHTKKAELKAAMSAIKQERSERQRADRTRALLRGAKREERGKVAAGKTPFFLKKREKRRLELEDRYEQLAKEGKLEKALSKKRRRNAAKDHRWLPRSRRGAGGGAEGGGAGDDEGRGWM